MKKYSNKIAIVLAAVLICMLIASVLPVSCYRMAEVETVPEVCLQYDRININKATFQELESIKGVGSVTANRIIRYREQHGKIKSVEELKGLEGVNAKSFNALLSKCKTD